jgi:hypothetical protein
MPPNVPYPPYPGASVPGHSHGHGSCCGYYTRFVESFNGRFGEVVPLPGDYSATDIETDGSSSWSNVQEAITFLAANLPPGPTNPTAYKTNLTPTASDVVTHSLDTLDVEVTAIRVSDGAHLVPDVSASTTNNITLNWNPQYIGVPMRILVKAV